MASTKETEVLVVGAGPVGMVTAYCLAQRGIRCILIERNHTTTKYPKMDYTNGRSMELFHRLGLVDEVRKLGVPPHHRLDEVISTGLADEGERLTAWVRPVPISTEYASGGWRSTAVRNGLLIFL